MEGIDVLWDMLTGGYTKWEMIGYAIFILMGMFLFSYLEVENRDRESKNTPKKFSWKFWIYDNIRRYIASILLVYILFRFSHEMMGRELDEFTALMMGFTADGIVGMKKKSINALKQNREKYMVKNKEE